MTPLKRWVAGEKRTVPNATTVHPRTCKHSFSTGKQKTIVWSLRPPSKSASPLIEAPAVGSPRTCIAFISLGDGRANVQSIHFHPKHWSHTQLNSDWVPAGTHRNRNGASCGRFAKKWVEVVGRRTVPDVTIVHPRTCDHSYSSGLVECKC